MDDIFIEPERSSDADALGDVVRRAFVHQPGVAEMVAAIRASPRYRGGLAFIARAGDRVVGFVMLSGTDLVDEAGARREVLTLTPLGASRGRAGVSAVA